VLEADEGKKPVFSYKLVNPEDEGVTGTRIPVIFTGNKPFHGLESGREVNVVFVPDEENGGVKPRHIMEIGLVL
jgi:hypothetical protein